MARSRIYDEDLATERAMTLFWRKGYEPTSITDLTEAMGINKGSLYHSFGSKQNLFHTVFLKYNNDYRRETLNRMAQNPDPLAAIDDLFAEMVAQSLNDTEKKGCFVINTALELEAHSPEVQAMVREGLAEFEDFFADKLTLARDQGRLPADFDVRGTAQALLALETGLRVLARGVFDAAALNTLRHQARRLTAV